MNKKEKIKKVINFKYEKRVKIHCRKSSKSLFAFLILMIGCTCYPGCRFYDYTKS